ncbi:MAG: hypothetical protein HJJLKODD_01610 [Phycisphaerae bacterium]|nr:hypothetical protein [Phycisphaerae bacterium]
MLLIFEQITIIRVAGASEPVLLQEPWAFARAIHQT